MDSSASIPPKSRRRGKISKRLLIKLAVVLVLLGIIGWLGYKNRYKIYYWVYGEVAIDRSKYPIVGIDISSHNGEIDFYKVKNEGYNFVIIKASEGEEYLDQSFASNYNRARANDLKVGAYHFFRKGTNGTNQAKNFVEAVGWRKLDLPLVIDIEDEQNDNVADDIALKNLNAMIDNLQSRGFKVMIYTNGKGYKKYVQDRQQVNIDVWLCSFKDPDEIKHIPHQLQQYSHHGKVKGIDGDVDLNVFNGSEKQWEEWLLKAVPLESDTTTNKKEVINYEDSDK